MGKLSVYLVPLFCLPALSHADWAPAGPVGGTGTIYELHVDGGFILAKSDQGFLPSYDRGKTWSFLPAPVDSAAYIMASVGSVLFMASTKFNSGYSPTIWRSPDSAKTWSISPAPPDSLKNDFGHITALVGCGRYLLAAADGGVFRSPDQGNTWIRSKRPVNASSDIQCFALAGSSLFATSYGTTWVSSDSGATWTLRCPSDSIYVYGKTLVGNGKTLLTSGALIYRLGERDTAWSQITRFEAAIESKGALVYHGSGFLVARGDTVFRSTDEGISWSPLGRVGATVLCFAADGNALLAGTANGGIYRSTDGGATWNRSQVSDAAIRSLATRGGNLYAGLSGVGGLYRTADHGASWAKVLDWVENNGLGVPIGDAFYPVGNGPYLYAVGSTQGELKRSRDAGLTWEDDGRGFKRLWQSDTVLLAEKQVDLYEYDLHRSLDSGSTWTPISKQKLGDLTAFKGDLAISIAGLTTFRSRDAGASWEPFLVNLGKANALALCGNDAFVASPYGLMRSSDSGSHWNLVRSDMKDITALYAYGTVLFAGRSPVSPTGQDHQDPKDARILSSTDQGVTWTPVSEGFISAAVTSFEVAGADLYAGTGGAGVWKRPLSELAPGISALGRGGPRGGLRGKRMLMGKAEKAKAMGAGLPLRDLSGRLQVPGQPGRTGPAFLGSGSP